MKNPSHMPVKPDSTNTNSKSVWFNLQRHTFLHCNLKQNHSQHIILSITIQYISKRQSLKSSNTVIPLKYNNYHLTIAKSTVHVQTLTVVSGSSHGREFACNTRDLGSVPGLGRSPGEGNGKPLQYSCLENSMERGAWWATVHGVAKNWTL